ncbi:MAG: hypothetical protein LBP62_01145 [Clostridiales bacterium]|nr:hypothetical protein [Clostridiales bacterium]
MKRFLRIFAFTLVLLASFLLIIGQPSASFSSDDVTDGDYSRIMEESVSGDPLVTEIAMLAAHDALSAGIVSGSPINYLDRGNILSSQSLLPLTESGILQAVAGGFAARISKAQKSSVYDLLKRGTRYLDVRAAEYGGGFYGCHGLIADPLSDFLDDALRFLEETEGEFIVVEFRHCYFDEKGYPELFEYIRNATRNGKNLFDYIRYDPTQIPLENLRYRTVVNGGSGVVILTPEAASAEGLPGGRTEGGLAYAAEPYAVWHNRAKESEVIDGIEREYALLKENPGLHGDVFRINQAQRTPTFSADSIIDSIAGWSLIDMAYKYNRTLLTHPDFKEWLTVMPVFQVDYTDGMYGDFNDGVIKIINEFNANLA